MKTSKKKKINKASTKKIILIKSFRTAFWFLFGMFLGISFLISSFYLFFKIAYKDVVYPGVIINNVNFGGKSEEEVKKYFDEKNELIKNTSFIFTYEELIATVSAKDIDFGYDSNLLATQAISIGRGKNSLSNISLITQSYINGVYLKPSYAYSHEKLKVILHPLISVIDKDPVNALFNFENNRVTAFQTSSDGQKVDIKELEEQIALKGFAATSSEKPKTFYIPLPVKTLEPETTTDKVNNLGIKEVIGVGTSLFQHSIQGRIYNITLASTRLNGVLIKPDEEFSFNKALGDVSSFTGYQQAYIIKEGRTVLGDGGGVCQVSTTLFRAALDAGLPITQRSAHAYRVNYYEQDSGPGLDATVYYPTEDLRFKNDTGHHILIQTAIDPTILKLTFFLYGTSDGRRAIINKPVILSQSPPPEPLYQDDPTLPKGVVRQIDYAAWGARVYFTREVTRNGKTIISDKFTSNYKPWQAIYLRGTKE